MSLENLKKELLADPEIKAIYDELEPEFKALEEQIKKEFKALEEQIKKRRLAKTKLDITVIPVLINDKQELFLIGSSDSRTELKTTNLASKKQLECYDTIPDNIWVHLAKNDILLLKEGCFILDGNQNLSPVIV